MQITADEAKSMIDGEEELIDKDSSAFPYRSCGRRTTIRCRAVFICRVSGSEGMCALRWASTA
ncbi:hypothetical protein EDD76_10957 [Kineothrix alysoides]|uniref:Uncharacterized protein n=1 Tax=Kineothrix alysoides TaxID=1469948 RepID=A0A4R1QWK3_9FIRM|nr:hypothetical protein EDD76_10957 [Kineothrix alysoides]